MAERCQYRGGKVSGLDEIYKDAATSAIKELYVEGKLSKEQLHELLGKKTQGD